MSAYLAAFALWRSTASWSEGLSPRAGWEASTDFSRLGLCDHADIQYHSLTDRRSRPWMDSISREPELCGALLASD